MSDAALSHADFRAFFKAVWGFEPFPWQQDLAARLAHGEGWPAVLDLPTGSGKTAALDIALFHLALEADRKGERRAPVRIAFVVDRRLIVDDAYTRAERLSQALAWSLASEKEAAALAVRQPDLAQDIRRVREEQAVKRVAMSLCGLAGPGQPPLVARRLRGGAPREDDWARTPVQPTILCSTVDQVGSRLLFRGYGVSDSMKPVHAGLLGSDCLILLDEAHLSEPFRQTLQWVGRLRAPDPAPFAVAVLTATPRGEDKGESKEAPFGLSAADESHPILSRRLTAPKLARLESVSGKEDARIEAIVAQTKAVLERLRASGVANPAAGVVVNRVARARAVFEQLKADLQDAANINLLIGPARSVDRNELTKELDFIRTGRDDARARLDKPLVVVATQTIEAGVDIDFDGLVTEVASLDALKQRFGRLNRAGRKVTPEAAILAHKGDIGTKADDAVYGDRIRLTWEKLQQIAAGADGFVDFGIEALKKQVAGDEAGRLAAPTSDAPILMPAYADLWSHTSPIPNADPDVALFLHGPDRSPASVQIVWRADLDEARDLRPAMGDDDRAKGARARLIELLELVPPRTAEAIEVPLWAARAWLDQAGADQASFSDAVERAEESGEQAGPRPRAAFRWAGEDIDRTGTVFGRALRNGDLIVVPADYGGCDRWGWNPEPADKGARPEHVADVADAALWPYRGRRFAVRVTPELVAQSVAQARKRSGVDAGAPVDREAIAAKLSELLAQHEGDGSRDLLHKVLEWCISKHEASGLPASLDGISDVCLPLRLKQLVDRCKKGTAPRVVFCRDSDEQPPGGVIFLAPRGLEAEADDVELAALPSTEGDELSVSSDKAVSIQVHCDDVRAWAQSFAVRAGLRPNEAGAAVFAALLHDHGKADQRFQVFLAGGDPYGPDVSEPLAKSGQKRLPPGARERAGLPPAWRHEALSVRLAMLHVDFKRVHDPELALWLIGTHHGHGRPLFPHADALDAQARDVELPPAVGGRVTLAGGHGPHSLAFDFGGRDWAQMFEALKQRYGIWGLARLEAFVRLADHRASELGAPPTLAAQKEAAE